MNPLPLVLANLRRHRFTFALFTLLVAVAVALGVAISATERALRQGSARAADKFDLVVAAPGSRTDVVFTAIYLKPGTVPLLDGAVVAKALAEKRAKIAAPIAFGDSHHGDPVVGTVAAFVEHLSGGLAQGRVFKTVREAVVGANSPLRIGETFRPQHGDGHGPADADADEEHEHPIEIEVVGRMKPTGTPWDRAIAVPVEQVWIVHGLPDGHSESPPADPLAIKIGPPFEGSRVPGAPAVILTPENVNSAYGLRNLFKTNASMAFFPAEVLVELYAVMGDVRSLLAAVALSAQILVALSILAALAALFAMNRRQFAVLRALGAPRAFFVAGAWLYVALILVFGAGLGLLLGVGAANLLAAQVAQQTGVALSAGVGQPEWRLVGVFVAAGLGLALIPALISARGSALEALTQA